MKVVLSYRLEKAAIDQAAEIATKLSEIAGVKVEPGAAVERAINMRNNYPDSMPVFPLIYELIKKGRSIKMLQRMGIEPPEAYKLGFNNNNCVPTGCVQGGIGYWQMRKITYPDEFLQMAHFEWELSELKGEPVTICKDQSKAAKARNGGQAELVWLLLNPAYPLMKDITMIKGRQPKPLMECNGFCGVNNIKDKTLAVAV